MKSLDTDIMFNCVRSTSSSEAICTSVLFFMYILLFYAFGKVLAVLTLLKLRYFTWDRSSVASSMQKQLLRL